ncbi:MAG: hypothetical protein M1822_007062 [Bathelium mastoideum]|nr:MAG: hypothetical protein M1822_007062 [Bathelium mastoideum]
MVDGLGAAGLAIESLCTCIKAINLLKHYAESVKNARQDVQKIIFKIEKLKNLFELMRTTLLQLRGTKFEGMELEIHEQELHDTMNELLTLAEGIYQGNSHMSTWTKMKWPSKKDKMGRMISRLQEQEDEVMKVILLIQTQTSIITQRSLEDHVKRAGDSSGLQVAFDGLTLVDEDVQFTDTRTNRRTVRRTWLGQIAMDSHSTDYNENRHKLADCVYWGDWNNMWQVLEYGLHTYGESWSVRSKEPIDSVDTMSFYTPLHQMVYNRASVEAIQMLLDMGASSEYSQ